MQEREGRGVVLSCRGHAGGCRARGGCGQVWGSRPSRGRKKVEKKEGEKKKEKREKEKKKRKRKIEKKK
jgi:hypothetical protein